MKKTTKRRFGALVVGLSLVAAACGGSSDSDSTATAGGELEGMKGTMPLVNLSAEFKDGMNAFWTAAGNTALEDYSYAAEAFDSVMLVALAAEAAKTDGSALAAQIQAVSAGGEACSDFAACVAIIAAGVVNL
jgi:ABC-type branched-subunit amino acid transport system substrate-binding protein